MARFLKPTVCLLLRQGPSHGYMLLERLEEFGLGMLNSGIVYRTLRDMEGNGWVTSTWDAEQAQGPPRRVYRLTARGDEMLNKWVQDLRQTRKQIDYLVDTHSRHMKECEGE
jgi:poly-beta-hydroxybutyrate-responsive repressor